MAKKSPERKVKKRRAMKECPKCHTIVGIRKVICEGCGHKYKFRNPSAVTVKQSARAGRMRKQIVMEDTYHEIGFGVKVYDKPGQVSINELLRSVHFTHYARHGSLYILSSVIVLREFPIVFMKKRDFFRVVVADKGTKSISVWNAASTKHGRPTAIGQHCIA